ncbi:MAG: hypothetical protein ABSC06_29335 [Rhodopila sp.]
MRRSVGPESETRGGPEAVDETLGDDGAGGSGTNAEKPAHEKS